MVKDQWGYEHEKTVEESKFYFVEFTSHESGEGLVQAMHELKNVYEPLDDSGTMGIYIEDANGKIVDSTYVDYFVTLEDKYMIVSFKKDIDDTFIKALQENRLMINWL